MMPNILFYKVDMGNIGLYGIGKKRSIFIYAESSLMEFAAASKL